MCVLCTCLWVLGSVLLSDAVAAERVVVEAAVLHQAQPLPPAGRDVASVVLVQVLPEESWSDGADRQADSPSSQVIHCHMGADRTSGQSVCSVERRGCLKLL